MQLSRRFTPLHLLLLSINGMIGSAWLFAPLYAAKLAGGGAIIAWLLGGAATIIIALTFAEVSALLPLAGGTTRVAELTQGSLTGFIISWITWLSCVTMPPIEVQAVLQYAATHFTSLTHMVNGMPVLSSTGLGFALVIMLSLCIINVASFRGLIGFNLLLFGFKVLVMILTCAMLMHTHFHTENFALAHFDSLGWKGILAAVASGGIAFAFTGFKHGVELAGEAKHTHITIPLAVVGSVVCCLILYIGLQVAFIGALSPAHLSAGWAKLSFSGDVGPFVGLAGFLGLFWLVKLLYVDAVVSPLGAGLIYVTSTARIIYAMSKNGYLADKFALLNKAHFPIWAIGLNFIVGCLLFLPLPGWQTMVSFLVSAVVISYAMGPIALLCLRKQIPEVKRPFYLPGAKLLCPLAFYCCNLISYWTGWETLSKLAMALALGLAILGLACWRGRIDKQRFGFKSLWWLLPYLMGLMLISYLGSFGGKGLITFGWDFLLIAIFSWIILALAIRFRQSHIVELYQDYQTTNIS